ncbi:MAG: DUF1127 domain-containing protein, partial [Pseudomonadota bacterium]
PLKRPMVRPRTWRMRAATMSHAINYGDASVATLDKTDGVIGKIRLAFRRYSVYRATFKELNELSQRDLDDIGVARSEIPFIAAENADLITRS